MKSKEAKEVSTPGAPTKSSAESLKPKEFRWMGFKSHMMATLAQWREDDYQTDATFQCLDGQVQAHRLILAAASPLLKEVMNQEGEEVVIFVPDVTSTVMNSILDLVYKGRMNITPTSTWAIRSLVQVLKINADDVTVITGAKKPPLMASPTPEPVTPVSSSGKPSRKRKQENTPVVVPIISKSAKMSSGNATPTAGSNGGRSSARKKSKKERARQASIKSNTSQDDLNESTGFHDLEDVETWVCAICQCYDPIITSPLKANPSAAESFMTTEWIGCDCNRWYHKYCTKLKHIDDSFSCKQLNRECLPLS